MFSFHTTTLDLRTMEKSVIQRALVHCKGTKRQAAEMLGIHRRTLYRKMDEYFLGWRGKVKARKRHD